MFVAFGRVVEDHVQEDLDVVAMQFLDQRLELIHLHAQLAGGGKSGLGGEEAKRTVAPVVADQNFARLLIGLAVLKLVILVNGQQFDTVDAQLFEIGNLLADAGKSAGKLDARMTDRP